MCALGASLWLAYLLRFDFEPSPEYFRHFATIVIWLIGAKLVFLALGGQFGSLLTYFGFNDALKIGIAMLSIAVAALLVWWHSGINYAPPRAVILTDFILSTFALCSTRMAFRLVRQGYFGNGSDTGGVRRIAIIGAGDVGATLVRDMQLRRGLGRKPIVFFDDDPIKTKKNIHGVPVIGPPEKLLESGHNFELNEVIIAMPSAPVKRIREVVKILNTANLQFAIVPSYEQLMTGKVQISQIRPVEIEDLLGREPIDLELDRISSLIQGQTIMVTGAGGSIGSELCRQIARHQPTRLLLVERCEVQLFQIEQRLLEDANSGTVVSLVADVLDLRRMRSIFERFKPQVVFHAAAHKHVPMMEHQPAEALHNNTNGTGRLADLAVQYGVERFVFVSTDKAINPTSVMGATKRLAEIYLQALQRKNDSKTKFLAVRFGNVLGSSGSVIPTFKRQIASGGPVTVTHPNVTRYFMTVQEAVGLVLQCATQGEGGEIFVLDMGKPMKIVDLARQLIELSGLRPDEDVEINFTGLRPGEKLFEELNHDTENLVPTNHPKIMRFVGEPPPLDRLNEELRKIFDESSSMDADQLKREINKMIPEYKPYFSIV